MIFKAVNSAVNLHSANEFFKHSKFTTKPQVVLTLVPESYTPVDKIVHDSTARPVCLAMTQPLKRK